MSDLVIGARRGGGRFRSALTIAALFAVIALVAIFIFRRLVSYPHPEREVRVAPAIFEDGALTTAGGRLTYAGNVAVVSLSGSSAQMGFAHGQLLARPIRRALEQDRQLVEATVASDGWFGSMFSGMRLRWRYRLLDDDVPGHHLVELAALARGAKLEDSYESLVRAQAIADLATPLKSSIGFDLHRVRRTLSLVTPIRDAAGDRLTVSHLAAEVGSRARYTAPVVFVVQSDDAIPYLSVGFPGEVGVTTGVNAAGLAIFVHPARAQDGGLVGAGRPTPLIARDVLERARTLDEAVALLSKADVLGAAAFLVVDGRQRTHAVVERSGSRFFVDREATIVDGILDGKPFRDDPENDRARRADALSARRDRARALLATAGKSGIPGLVEMLRDRRDASLVWQPAGHRATVDDPFASVAVLVDPSAMLLWVGEGPGAMGAMRALDLRYSLGLTEANTPAADVAAADAKKLGDAQRVVTARVNLESALALSASGDSERASERAEAAVTLAPTWPLARRVAARLARKAGDSARADAHERAYLRAPDSEQALKQMRAH